MARPVSYDEFRRLLAKPETPKAVRDRWAEIVKQHGEPGELWVAEGGADPNALARIYTVRLANLRSKGRKIGGFEETINALKGETGECTAISITAGRCDAVCFVTAGLQRVLGLLYVEKRDDAEPPDGLG